MTLLARKTLALLLTLALVAWGSGAESPKTAAPGAPMDSSAKQELEDPEAKPKLHFGSRCHRKAHQAHALSRAHGASSTSAPKPPGAPGSIPPAAWLANPPLLI